MKVKLSAHWCTSEEITERLILQFKTSSEDMKNIEFVHDDTYDLIIFFNYISEKVPNDKHVYLFAHEPTWSGSHQKSLDCMTRSVKYFTHDKRLYSEGMASRIYETPARCFYGGRGPWCDSYKDWSYESLIDRKFPKNKPISSVVTTWKGDEYPSECLYNDRFNLISNIGGRLPYVDFFGGWDRIETNNTLNTLDSPYKIDAVRDYKFCLVIENQNIKNWITEKFYDCILTDTIPIYFGCSNLSDIWPHDGYIQLASITNMDYIVETIDDIHANVDDIYNEKIINARKIKHQYFSSNSLLKFIKTQMTIDGFI